jgi:hypothetical protein
MKYLRLAYKVIQVAAKWPCARYGKIDVRPVEDVLGVKEHYP